MQMPTMNCRVRILHTRNGVHGIASRYIRASMGHRRIIPRSDPIRKRMLSKNYEKNGNDRKR